MQAHLSSHRAQNWAHLNCSGVIAVKAGVRQFRWICSNLARFAYLPFLTVVSTLYSTACFASVWKSLHDSSSPQSHQGSIVPALAFSSTLRGTIKMGLAEI